MGTGGGMLDPLQARLLCYGFAVVYVDADCRVSPRVWGIPQLEVLWGNAEKSAWGSVLAACAPFCSLHEGPVISPSLKALRTLRMGGDRRPLIWCRTRYEPVRKDLLSSLMISLRQPWMRVLAREDPFLVLHWGSGFCSGPHRFIWAYRQVRDHPLDLLAERLADANPFALVSRDACGRVLLQPDLWHPFSSVSFLEMEKFDLRILDRLLVRQFEHLKGRYYLFSRNKRIWERFCEDLHRVLYRPPTFSFNASHVGSARQRLVFVPATDAELRFAQLQPLDGCFHLDGDRRTFWYRQSRFQKQYSHGWWSEYLPVGWANHRVGDHQIRLVHIGTGWTLLPLGGLNVINHTLKLERDLRLLQRLHGRSALTFQRRPECVPNS